MASDADTQRRVANCKFGLDHFRARAYRKCLIQSLVFADSGWVGRLKAEGVAARPEWDDVVLLTAIVPTALEICLSA
jgi:hypothetical protein